MVAVSRSVRTVKSGADPAAAAAPLSPPSPPSPHGASRPAQVRDEAHRRTVHHERQAEVTGFTRCAGAMGTQRRMQGVASRAGDELRAAHARPAVCNQPFHRGRQRFRRDIARQGECDEFESVGHIVADCPDVIRG